jgi:hypothetical protein
MIAIQLPDQAPFNILKVESAASTSAPIYFRRAYIRT